MLQDDEPHIGKLALRGPITARKVTKGRKVCAFRLPQPQIRASYYYDLIDWRTTNDNEIH